MKSNEFQLVNMAGGRHGGTYRMRADGRLPLRAVRALVHALAAFLRAIDAPRANHLSII